MSKKDAHLLEQLVAAGDGDSASRAGMEERRVAAEAALAELLQRVERRIREARRKMRRSSAWRHRDEYYRGRHMRAALVKLRMWLFGKKTARAAGGNRQTEP